MADVFISYAEANRSIAQKIADVVPMHGYSAWLYHRDSIPGVLHVETTNRQIEQASVMVALISRASLQSDYVFSEILHAISMRKHLLPVLIDVTYDDLRGRKPRWAMALGLAVALEWQDSEAALTKISKGLAGLIGERTAVPAPPGNNPGAFTTAASDVQLRQQRGDVVLIHQHVVVIQVNVIGRFNH